MWLEVTRDEEGHHAQARADDRLSSPMTLRGNST